MRGTPTRASRERTYSAFAGGFKERMVVRDKCGARRRESKTRAVVAALPSCTGLATAAAMARIGQHVHASPGTFIGLRWAVALTIEALLPIAARDAAATTVRSIALQVRTASVALRVIVCTFTLGVRALLACSAGIAAPPTVERIAVGEYAASVA
jgi:hypothetical protein